MSRVKAFAIFLGSLLFLVMVPGTVAGFVPYWLTGWQLAEPSPGAWIGRGAGTLLLLAGLGSLLDSFLRFALDGVGTPAPIAPPKTLVVSGQYRCVRNPMYLAVFVMVVGQGCILGNPVVLVYALSLWVIFHALVVFYEEPRLGKRFGASYREYCRHVGRWWPRMKPWSRG